MTTYTCDECGGVFEKGHSDEEAEAEALRDFGVPNASTNDAMAIVCDDCYRRWVGACAEVDGVVQ